MATAQPTTAGLSRGWYGLPNTSSAAKYMPSRTPTLPDVTGRQKEYQEQQPSKSLPVHHAIIQSARLIILTYFAFLIS
jgi:hypothetical protein